MLISIFKIQPSALLMLVLLSIFSCTTTKNKIIHSNSLGTTVDISKNNHDPKPLISESKASSDLYGPLESMASNQNVKLINQDKDRNPVIGLYIQGTGYRSFGAIGVLKALSKNNIPIHLISGDGFGLLISSLYAKYKSINSVEWRSFKVIQSLQKSYTLYSEIWLNTIREHLIANFGALTIQELPVQLLIPELDGNGFRSRGKLVKHLIPHIAQNRLNESFGSVDLNSLRRKGADIILHVDLAFNEKLTIKQPYKLFGKTISEKQSTFNRSVVKGADIIIPVSSVKHGVDRIEDVFSFINLGNKSTNNLIGEIKDYISQWSSRER